MSKTRADLLLQRSLAPTREAAQRLILARADAVGPFACDILGS